MNMNELSTEIETPDPNSVLGMAKRFAGTGANKGPIAAQQEIKTVVSTAMVEHAGVECIRNLEMADTICTKVTTLVQLENLWVEIQALRKRVAELEQG